MSETPTTPHASRFTELTTEQLEANRRSVYAYAVPPAPEVVSLPNGTCSVDTGVGRTVFASPAPFPGLQAAEARATEAEAQVAMLKTELAEAARELSYEQQMRQQTEGAMVKLADRVKEERADADRFQVQVLTLMRRELFLMRLLNEAQHALKQLFGPKMPSMETIRGLAHDTHTSLCQADPLLGSKCAKCQGVVNAYGQCFYCDTTEPGLCN